MLFRSGTAEITYQATYNGGFSPNLTSLCPPAAGTPAGTLKADLVDAVMCGSITAAPTSGTSKSFNKSGYGFTYAAAAVNSGTFLVTCTPIAVGSSGQNAFCTDQTSVIHRNTTGTGCATADTPI